MEAPEVAEVITITIIEVVAEATIIIWTEDVEVTQTKDSIVDLLVMETTLEAEAEEEAGAAAVKELVIGMPISNHRYVLFENRLYVRHKMIYEWLRS